MLATRTWSLWKDLNLRPTDYEPVALPIELSTVKMAGDRRLERRRLVLETNGLPVSLISQNVL